MGVFDSLKIEYKLPDQELPKEGWQTKSLGCSGSLFILTAGGRLLERVPAIELRDGVVCETDKWKNIDRNFEGVFNVYHIIDDQWLEYEIVMIDGEVELAKSK